MESTPTPYTVMVSPKCTFGGRILSISSRSATRSVMSPGWDRLSKFAAAARIVVVPDLMPTMWPFGSTVATAELPLDQTKLTFVISTESPVPTSCQARAVASVSFPRIRIGSGVTLTCTSASCSVG